MVPKTFKAFFYNCRYSNVPVTKSLPKDAQDTYKCTEPNLFKKAGRPVVVLKFGPEYELRLLHACAMCMRKSVLATGFFIRTLLICTASLILFAIRSTDAYTFAGSYVACYAETLLCHQACCVRETFRSSKLPI
jgi:hypothetical protein